MSREKELVKNTFILGLGKFLPRLVSIVTLPIVTACLTKSEYGTYDLVATLVMLLMPIATLQIQSAAFRFLIDCRDDKDKSAIIITNIYIVVLPVSFIVSLGIYIFMPNLSAAVKAAMALYFFFDSIETTMAQVTRGLGKNKNFSISSVVLSFVNGLGIIFSLKLINAGLFGVIMSLAVANIVALIYLSIITKISKYISLSSISVKQIKKMLSYSWPMIPNNLSNWVLKLSDRLVITTFLGIEANAVYAVANKIPNLLSIAQNVMVMAWQENASMAVNDKDATAYYTKMFDRIFSLMIGFTCALIGFTPIMFKLLIRGDYDDAYVQMPVLILGMFFYCMASFQGGIYIAHKKTKSVGVTTMVAAGINLAIDFLFVKQIGITAGSLSTLIAYLVLYIFRMIDSVKFQPINYHIKKQLVYFAFIGLMLVICFIRNFYLNILNLFIGIIAFVLLNREMLEKVFLKGLKMLGRK